MCGLISILAKTASGFYTADKDIFNQLLYADVLRGSDATGVFGVKRNGNLDMLKQAAPAGWFLASKQYNQDFQSKIVSDYQFMVGHNRKATHGERKDVDAHPFYTEPICLVHNGMISNHKELCKESTVDSNAVCNAFAEGNFKEVLKGIEGAYAFIWYNIKDKTLYFIRNDKRPLYIIETNNTYILASEKEMVVWICSRNNQAIKGIRSVEPGTLYSFDLADRELKEEKLDLKPVSTVFPINQQNITYLPRRNVSHRKQSVYPSVDKRTLLLTDNYFLDEDADIESTINPGDQVFFEVEEIEDYNSPQFSGTLVKVSGALLNCPKTPITVVGFIPLSDIKDITQDYIATGTANRLEEVKDGWKLWVHSAEASFPAIKSANDEWITNDMWMSETFDCHCKICNAHVLFEELNAWEVYLDTDDTKVVCPKCLAEEAIAC